MKHAVSTMRRVMDWTVCFWPLRGQGRVPVALAVVALLLGMAGGTVYAHKKEISGWVYYSSADCTRGYAMLDHGSGGGKMRGYTAAYYWSGVFPNNCSLAIDVSKGHLRVRVQKKYWAWWNAWETCYDTGWYYNPRSAWKLTVTTTFGSYPFCGARDYSTHTGSHVKWGSWHGGTIATGSQYLP